jgi:hypothetical protein
MMAIDCACLAALILDSVSRLWFGILWNSLGVNFGGDGLTCSAQELSLAVPLIFFSRRLKISHGHRFEWSTASVTELSYCTHCLCHRITAGKSRPLPSSPHSKVKWKKVAKVASNPKIYSFWARARQNSHEELMQDNPTE